MIAHDLFRLSLDEVTRRHKRSPIFRHPLFAVGELEDPLEPGVPFNMQAPLPEIEREWKFTRDAVPAYIKLTVGRAARERSLAQLQKEYTLPPAERFKLIEGTVKVEQYNVNDPETWDTPFFCAIKFPAEYINPAMPVHWFGNRSVALTDPRVRPWFFDPRSTVLHGKAAVDQARQAFSIAKGPL
jgi:hypothetical protein